MMTTLLSIWLLHVAALAGLGPNALLVAQIASGDRGRNAAFAAAGIAIGGGVWSALAVLGVSAVFEAVPRLRLVLQIAGGLYLLYVATRLWRSGSAGLTGSAASLSAISAFRVGLLTNMTNPRSALFFGSAFAAAFPADPGLVLLLAVIALVTANALLWYLMLALLFSRARVRSTYSTWRRFADRFAAVLMGVLGVRLLGVTIKEATQ